MMSLMLIGNIRQIGSSSWHTLGFSAFILLLVDPRSLFDIGFQLSFAAVAGILIFYRPLEQICEFNNVWLEWYRKMLIVALSAQMGVFPLLLYYFHRMSIIGILFSPIYVIIATGIIYAALLLLMLSTIGCGYIVRILLEFMVSLQHGLMNMAIQIPYEGIKDCYISCGTVVLLYASVLCLLPSIHALHKPDFQPNIYRWAMLFRTWPYILSFILLLLSAVSFESFLTH